MKEGGRRLKEVVRELRPQIKAGMTTAQIDKIAESLIVKKGGQPSFKKVRDYFWSTCLTVNEQIVHTPPSAKVLKTGDILTVDIGIYYKGFHTDYADTVAIGKIDVEIIKFLAKGKKTLDLAIKKLKIGNRLGQISQVIEKEITGAGYSIVKELTGHGIGRELHEDPYIPGFLDRTEKQTPTIKPGLVIAVEVIYSLGSGEMMHETENNWSIRTSDSSLSACFEHTVAVTYEPEQSSLQGETDTNTIILT